MKKKRRRVSRAKYLLIGMVIGAVSAIAIFYLILLITNK